MRRSSKKRYKHRVHHLQHQLTVNDFFGGFDGVFILGNDRSSGRSRRSSTIWSKTVVADYRSSAMIASDTGTTAVLHGSSFDYG